MKIQTTCGLLRQALHKVKTAARGNREGVATFIVTPDQFEVQMSGGGSLARAYFPIEGDSSATAVLNGLKALSVLSTADPASLLEVTFTEKTVRLKFENADIKLALLDAETELLTPSAWLGGNRVIQGILAKEFKDLIAKVSYAAGDNDLRYYINTINICDVEGRLSMVATNGHVLSAARSEFPVPAGTSLLMPIEVGLFLRSLLHDDDVINIFELKNSDGINGLGVRTNGFELKTPLVCGKFPDWRKIMPTEHMRIVVTLPCEPLRVAIERVKFAAVGKLNLDGVKVSFSDGYVRISDKSGENFDLIAADTGKMASSGWECSFNPELLTNSLGHIGSNVRLIVDPANNQAPLLMTEDIAGDNWGGLVMPLKV